MRSREAERAGVAQIADLDRLAQGALGPRAQGIPFPNSGVAWRCRAAAKATCWARGRIARVRGFVGERVHAGRADAGAGVVAALRGVLPPDLAHDDPPLPVDSADACDTVPDHDHPKHERGMPYPHTRQPDAIAIDQDRDVISADGRELYRYVRHRGIAHVLELGVHTNMCILNRTFSIKPMVRWGVEIALVRDLTDAMYNPARPPT